MLDLNAPQARAVLHGQGPLLVFAGAGSGKTRVITYRIARLMAEERIAPHRILAVTFTNKAAAEMQRRLAELAGEALSRELWVGTFHSLCARLLRRYGSAIGLSSKFVIYDDSDQKALLNRIIRKGGYDEKTYPAKLCQSRISHKKRDGLLPPDVTPSRTFDATLCDIYAEYERSLGQADAVDFDDLILKMVHLLRADPSVRSPAGDAARELRQRFEYVLVDEFQDTNGIQYEWVRALSARTGNLCVVGDDDQSIYSWRGADVRNIRDFVKDHPSAAVVKLEQNYRSTGNIVAAARGVIEQSRDRAEKVLWTEEPDGEPILLQAVTGERDEARYVVDTIRRELATGTPPNQIAVFYRINAQSRVLEEALRSVNLPYQVVGGMRFFERAEVKNLLAYLRLIENPRSDADLVRVINVPARGIGNRTLDKLLSDAANKRISVFSALTESLREGTLPTATRKRLEAFHGLVSDLAKTASQQRPSELAEAALSASGYRTSLKEENTPEADARLENLAELVGSIKEYELEADIQGRPPSLVEYLERVALVSDIDSVKAESAVLLMTVHSAKGLEFNTVFLTGMEEETFPYRGLESEDSEELGEERRLAYVAITRARRRLYITHAATRTLFGQTRYLAPSRFLADIPREVMTQVGLDVGTYGATDSRPFGFGASRPSPPPRPAWSGRPGGWAAGGNSPLDPRAEQSRRPGSQRPAPQPTSDRGTVVDYDAFDDVTPTAAAAVVTEGSRRRSTSPSAAARDVRSHLVKSGATADAGLKGIPFALGARVLHRRFGHGIVEKLEDDTKVWAYFKGYGVKQVLCEYLSPAPEPT